MECPATRNIPPVITRHSYWLLVLLPLLMPASFALRDWPGMSTLFAWMPLVVLYGLLPLLDLLIGLDSVNPELGFAGTGGLAAFQCFVPGFQAGTSQVAPRKGGHAG